MQTIKQTIKGIVNKGQFFSLVANKNTQDCDKKLRKVSTFRGRVTATQTYTNGRVCDYEHLAEVKEKREQGVEAVKPTWWEWTDFPFFARHKTNGTEYLVVKKADVNTQYFLDNEKICKKDYPQEFLADNKSESLVYMVKLADIVSVKAGGKFITEKEYAEVG